MSIKIILKNIQASGNTELFSKYIVIEQLQSGVHKEKFNYDSEFTNLEENFDIDDASSFQSMIKFCHKYISFLLFLKGYDIALYNVPKEAKTIETLQLETITTDHILDTLFMIDESVENVKKISSDIYAAKCKQPEILQEKLHQKLLGGSIIDVENLCQKEKFKTISYRRKPQKFDFYIYLMIEYFFTIFLAVVGMIAFPQIQTMYAYFTHADLSEFDFYLEIVGRSLYLFLITYCVDVFLNGKSSLLVRHNFKF